MPENVLMKVEAPGIVIKIAIIAPITIIVNNVPITKGIVLFPSAF